MNLPWLRKRPKRKKGLEHQPMFKIKEKFPNEYLTKPWWKNIWETFTNSFKYKNVSNVDVLVEEIKKASTVSHITSDEVWQMISTDKSGVEKEPLFDVLFVEIANITDEHKKKAIDDMMPELILAISTVIRALRLGGSIFENESSKKAIDEAIEDIKKRLGTLESK